MTSSHANAPPDALGASPPAQARRIFVLGATGTAGRAMVQVLLDEGHEVVCFVRPGNGAGDSKPPAAKLPMPQGVEVSIGEVTDPASLARDGFKGERFDVVISCLASRTGAPKDAWAIDHRAHVLTLEAAQAAAVSHFILLSAICVQKPLLAFQHAKLAFERTLMVSGLRYSIVRPTAFFKSLSGQIERVKRGKPFLLFGDGALTACKPISDEDLAHFIVECLEDERRWNQVLPIGGPGAAITPREQGERLFALMHLKPKFKSVPVGFLDVIIIGLSLLGAVLPWFAGKAELARIGRYYATESMLVLDPTTGRYDASATPSTGQRTLFDFYAEVIAGSPTPDLGDHAVFANDG